MRTPRLTVDVILRYKKGLVLILRKNYPSGWALPGGFVKYGERVERAAAREVKEETGLRVKNLRQFRVYSDPKRDPRGHIISVVFTADGVGKLRAATDAKRIGIFEKGKMPKNLAFDHAEILRDYFGGK